MRNIPEGGLDAPLAAETAQAPRIIVDPEKLYYSGKMGADNYLAMLGTWAPSLLKQAKEYLQNSRNYSSRPIAEWFEALSDNIWRTNSAYSLFGLSDDSSRIPIQEKFNNRLWSYNNDGSLNHITSDHVVPLFRKGDMASWPNLILTSNHARAWRSDDLSQLMQGVERMAGDAWKSRMDSHRLTRDSSAADTGGKNLILLACHTERDIFRNGANLINRRLNLLEDPHKDTPEKRSLKQISPASIRLAKLILKTMLEPACAAGVNLDLAVDEVTGGVGARRFIAEDALNKDRPFVLRADAASIAQHIKLVGYSRGANTVTDALRFLYRECIELGDRLQVTGKDGMRRTAEAGDIQAIISNIGILSLAPGEVPLTRAERETVGIRRTTIFNEHDLTAGHLINPDKADYDIWSDKLIRINGTHEEAGHSLVEALGSITRPGYMMSEERARNSAEYQDAQDEVRAFFASNFRKNAVTGLCLNYRPELKTNELYVQFAPGISRADERNLETELLDALRDQGFPQARAFSDLSHRRRMQIVLEEGAPPIGENPNSIRKCKQAFDALRQKEHGDLFVVRSALGMFDTMLSAARPDTHVHSIVAARAAAVGTESCRM